MSRNLIWTAVAALLALMPCTSRALDYPTTFVRIVVPYLPGGSAETQARILAEELQKQWDKPVIIENKPGAGTTIGAAFVANAKPDGLTLYIASTSHTVVPSLYKKLAYDPITSFEPISLISASPFLVLVKNGSGINTLADLVAKAKASPGTMSWASSGIGAGPHLSGELFKAKAKIDVVHVPFTGAPPSFQAVLGGHVDYVLGDITALPLVRSGALKALAVTTPRRSPLVPDVPTFVESGYSNIEIWNWSSLIAPAGTPPDVVNFINLSVVRALQEPEVKERFEKVGFTPQFSTREELAAFLKSEMQKYSEVIRLAGIKPQ